MGTRRVGLTDQPTTIGRSSGNLVMLDDHLASRFHCVIEAAGDGYVLRDLQSRNGTKLNGSYVDQAALKSGDVIEVGHTQIRFVEDHGVGELEEAEPEAAKAKVSKKAKAVVEGPVLTRRRSSSTTIAAAGAGEGGETLAGDGSGAPVSSTRYKEAAPLPVSAVPINLTKAAASDFNTLRLMARSLPNQQFQESEIALVNARGQPVHSASDPALARSGEDVGAEAVNLLRLLLLVCFRSRATDLHVEPKDNHFEARMRVDGIMVPVMVMKSELGAKLLSLIKILGDIDIAQRSIVQEGHFTTQVPGRSVDYRISFTPAMHGQKLVLRVLDLANSPAYLKDLELPGWMYEELKKAIGQDTGMVLMCGPTGSGKTTTLYAMIREIDVSQRNVITIEDPVEYRVEGVTQIPINDAKGNTFSNLLRSVLRQDPDVILVGEIRDPETAKIAMQAAMTGHLVFSTVHAQSAVGTIYRLLDLGVDPFLVASAIHMVVAQRLVRKLCPHCKIGRRATPSEVMRMSHAVQEVGQIQQAIGCPKCLNTGFHGRKAIFELLVASQELRDVILSTKSLKGMRKALENTVFNSLLDSGYRLVAEGSTTIEEVERTVGTDSVY